MTNTAELKDITAAVIESKGGDFKFEKLKIRSPQDNEVLVKISAAGLCHTDLIIRDQYYPMQLPVVLGHEGSGVVEAIGKNVTDVEVGDHVVLSYGYCGKCEFCHDGQPAYCIQFNDLNMKGSDDEGHHAICNHENKGINDHFFAQSSFATYAIAQESNTIKVPKDIPIELLGPLGCGIQTGAGASMNALKVSPSSSFVTWGTGAVGLSGLLGAKVCGASIIIAVDVVDSRLELAKELGATHVINSKNEDPVAKIQEITKGGTAYALETTGRPEIFTQAVAALTKLGKLAVVGAPPIGTMAELDWNDFMIGGKIIMGVIEGNSVPKNYIPELVELYRLGRFPFDKLVKFYDFKDLNQAVTDSEKGITLKAIVKIA